MEKTIVGIVSLVVGAGLGFLLGNTLGDKGTAETDEESASIRPGASGDSASGAGRGAASSSRPGQKPGTGGNIATFLDLVNPFNALNNRELNEQVDQLGTAELATLVDELEMVAAADNRSRPLRNLLFARWAKLDPDGAWLATTKVRKIGLRAGAISIVLGEIARTDFPKARSLVDSLENGLTKQAAINGMIMGATQESPELAFDLIAQAPGVHTSSQLHQLFQQWALGQPEIAIAKIKEIEGLQQRNQALNGLISGLAASDPERALAFAKALENRNERRQALNTAVTHIASSDPQRALELLADIPTGSQRQQMIGNIASEWSKQDANAAMEWIQTLAPSEKNAAMNHSIWQFSLSDPKTAAELIQSMPTSNSTSHLYQNLTTNWAQSDSEAASAWVNTLPIGAARQQAVNGLLNAYQNHDPAKAADLLSKEGITINNSYMAGNIFGNWVTTDQDAAVAWLDGMETGAMRNAVSSAMQEWAQHDAAQAAEYALGIDVESTRKRAVNSIMSSWGQNEPEAAKDWALSNLDGDIKAESLSSLIQNVANNDPKMALELYAETTASLTDAEINKSFSSVASNIARSWSRYDSPGAAEWVMDLPEGDQRSQSLRYVIDNWSEADPVSASEFVGALPEGGERDSAVESLVRRVQQNDPESAFIWAESITDEKKRSNVVRNAAMQWKEIDADAAFQAVGNADIPDEAKVQLLKQLQE